jgi:integrase
MAASSESARSDRYDLRIRLAVRKLTEWLGDRPEGNSVRGVTKRAAAHFTDHFATTLNPNTLKGWKSGLSLYWDWMATREEVENNPWKEVKLGRRQAAIEPPRAFTDDEMCKLFAGTDDVTIRDFMLVAALSGMRENEIGRLKVSDTEGDWFDVKISKTRAGVRRVPIHPDLAPLVTRRTAGKEPGDWLFDDLPLSNGKSRGRADKMGERFTNYRRSIGVDDRREDGRSTVVFHSFRHWFSTAAVNAGAMEAVVGSLVGHAGQGMTLGTYYSGPTKQLLIDAVAGVRLPTTNTKEPP